jgi:hypothetical protein
MRKQDEFYPFILAYVLSEIVWGVLRDDNLCYSSIERSGKGVLCSLSRASLIKGEDYEQ